MDNLNILVEAKREYLEQLSILMCPAMIDVFDAMYQEAHKLSKGRKVLLMFQQLLRDVPEWNETMAKQHTDNIANRCSWFKNLVAAVFVSSVKILSAVRLSNDSKKLSVKLPSNELFIHSCYKNGARDLYKDPYIFTENQSEHDRNDKLYERLALCIENTVKELIPVQDILQTYMTDQPDEIINPSEMDMQGDDVEEYDDSSGGVDPAENLVDPMGSTGETLNPEPPTESTPSEGVMPDFDPDPVDEEPQNLTQEIDREPQRDPFEDEFRTIKSSQAQQQAPSYDEGEDLFPDASETRTKKLSY